MRKHVVPVIAAALLAGCATPYTPTEYPLREGLIPQFDVAGPVVVSNAQASNESVVVYSYMGSKMTSDLKSITEVMVQQTQKEIQKDGRQVRAGEPKTISLKVTSLLSKYITFFWKSNIEFQAILGNGQTIDMKVPHTSGVLLQDLNGCIAEGVLKLLNDERVKSYLAA